MQGGTYRYEYTLRDHLGNTRVTFADLNADNTVTESEILQQNHYYPFGMNMEGSWGVEANKYQYNGKELNTDFGLDWNGYGARWYDAGMGRFTTADPLASDMAAWSPYVYTFNNPLSYFDLFGLAPYSYNWGTGQYENEEGNAVSWGEVKGSIDGQQNENKGNNGNNQNEDKGKNENDCCPGAERLVNYMNSPSYVNKPKEERLGELLQAYDTTTDILIELDMMFVGGKAIQLTFKGGRWIFGVYKANKALKNSQFIVRASKFDYFFGRVVSGNSHNIERSAQNLKDLTTLGINSEAQLMKVFANAFANGTNVGTKTSQYGTTVIKSVNIGSKGKIEVSFFYSGGNMSSAPSITTIIPKIFK